MIFDIIYIYEMGCTMTYIEKLENYYKKAYSTLNPKINYDKNAVPDKYQKMIEITDEFHRLYLESKKVKQLSKEK